ncbi:hypothetical protein GCM10010420_44820 [Streptomyces glaucosporus]|uniref:Uncharacterized protein n=1 Tax=Streptomyces glaucosporus TaxID=284044 RepID=A0ABN3IQF3_9ACTN
MKYVVVSWDAECRGFWTDPRDYVHALDLLRGDLPEGAREFATDPSHYDFYSERCVKDLRLSKMELPGTTPGDLRIVFSPNPWKHAAGLVIEYSGVRRVDISEGRCPWDQDEGYGTVLLDEILPSEAGCSHEIALSVSTLRIECADLVAGWAEAGR